MSDLSRVEQLLRNALGEDLYEVTPQSRVEVLLVELNELIEGMGGGSVSPEDIATAVAAYLDEHLTNPTNPPVDTSLTIAGAAADAKKVGDEIAELKEDLTQISTADKNFFDPSYMVSIADWTENDGVWSGNIHKLYQNFYQNNKRYPFAFPFEANKRYTLTLYAKNDGETTTGAGLAPTFFYSDGTSSTQYISNAQTTYSKYVLTSRADKTVVAFGFNYGSGAQQWSIKEIQIEEGISSTTYMPYNTTAKDLTARRKITDKINAVNPYLFPEKHTVDFNGHAVGTTYQGEWFSCEIAVGETVTIEIVCPANDANTSYLNFNDANGNRLNPSGLYAGTRTRTVTFTNNYASAVDLLGVTLVKVNEQNTYTVIVTRSKNLVKKVDELEERVSGIENVIGDADAVPSYFDTQLSTAIATARSNMANTGIDGETFVFLSDIHWENNSKHSPALIREITGSLPIENTVFGGDSFNGGTQATMIGYLADIYAKFSKVSKRFIAIHGNHDNNQLDGGTAFTHNEFYTFLQKPSDYFMKYGSPYYFYFDNPTTKTRFIVLDSRTSVPSSASDQLAWLDEITGNIEGWHIIVFMHVLFYPDTGGSWNDPTTWIPSTFFSDVMDALDAINTAGTNKVEAIFGGHCHLDWNTETTGGIPIVLIDCDTRQTQSSAGNAEGTINEQCLDVVTVDYTAEKIYCVRVGRGSDRTITY